MNSASGQRLSMEELKRLNQPPQSAPMPPVHPPQQEWEELLARLERLEASAAAQEALLRGLNRQVGQLPTKAQLEALARDVAAMLALLKQAGKQSGKRFSLPKLRLPYIPWSSLLLGMVALALTGLVLWVVWSSLGRLWTLLQTLLP